MKRISIPYFHIALKYSTILFIAIGIYLTIIGYPIWTAALLLASIIILTTKYVTEIDLINRECRDFLSFLGIPFEEETVKFEMLDRIVVEKENRSQMLNSRSRSRQLDWNSFSGTLIMNDNKSLELLAKTDKNDLLNALKDFADFLKVDIEDRTTKVFFVVYSPSKV